MNEIAKTGTSALALSEPELLKVLSSSLYPGASADSIKLVLGYCKAAGLDPMQKPVHIVPMWDSKSSSMRDVVMPGIGLYRTQASRSGEMGGITEPEFGEDVTESLGGAQITYPKWCKVVCKRRLATGEIVDFTAKEFWKENYAIRGGKDKSIAPNAMWAKRPYGQIAKCAEAQALRKAFPELGSAPAAEEMEGKAMQQVIDAETGEIAPSFDLQAALNHVELAETIEWLDEVWAGESVKATNAKDKVGFNTLKEACKARKTAIVSVTDVTPKTQPLTAAQAEFAGAME